MAFKLRTIEFTADGREIVRDKDLAGRGLAIGRDAANDIHLPDLAVEPRHAVMALGSDGQVKVEAVGTLGFDHDGKSVTVANIDARTGGELQFASYRIAISRDGDAVLLTLRQVDSNAQASAVFDEKRSFTLANVLPGRRMMAWVLALVVLAAFLIVPVASNLSRGDDSKVINEKSWNPGSLSLVHHSLENNCTACHVKPFESVRDASCQSCHKSVHDHAPMVRMAGARGEYPWGQAILWKVAQTFGKPGPGGCVDCHSEHAGAGRMEPTRQEFCASCHGDLKTRLTDTKLVDAADFGTSHPQFKVVTATQPGQAAFQRVSLDANPRESNGLIFPHKMHLDPLGGVAKMAASLPERGYGNSGMVCADCHRPVEQGVRFKAIDMERDCEGCHSLVYDQYGPYFRTLRHGDVGQTIADLRATGPSRSFIRPIIAGRMTPGGQDSGQIMQQYVPPALNGDPVARAFSRGGLCGECHIPALQGGFGITPVKLTERYITKGWFDHRSHTQAKCSVCHSAQSSSESSDILMPGIAQCRSCHMGESAHVADVPSSCAMCHSYHSTALPAPKRGKKDS